jgi:3-hydroxyisobutyrate dehydrogenase-like beta-hydroxyacid dehydrogenase
MNLSMRICLLGFGEVGQTLAADLTARGANALTSWDILFAKADSAPSRAIAATGVRAGANAREAVTSADLIISAVTAAQDIEAARSVAPYLHRGAYFLDLNSVSPGAKQEAHRVIDSAGVKYVESAIMSPIAPRRIASPMLLGGPHAASFLPVARELGFEGAQVFSDQVGRASAAKMCRSVIVKGLESLLCESLLSARRYGVEDTVLESLRNLFASDNWQSQSRYMISRSLIHGRRRAEEMREVARTVADAGFEPWMSSACARWQDLAADYREAEAYERLHEMLDAMLARQARQERSR